MSRPYPALDENAQAQLLRHTPNLGDRLILRILLDHDEGEEAGAYPGYKTIAGLSGYAPKTVRNRLSALRRAGVIVSRRGRVGRLTSYFVKPPDPSSMSPHARTSTEDSTSPDQGTSRRSGDEIGGPNTSQQRHFDDPAMSRHGGHSMVLEEDSINLERDTKPSTDCRGARAILEAAISALAQNPKTPKEAPLKLKQKAHLGLYPIEDWLSQGIEDVWLREQLTRLCRSATMPVFSLNLFRLDIPEDWQREKAHRAERRTSSVPTTVGESILGAEPGG